MSQARAKRANPFLEISANGLRKQGSPSKPEEPRHNALYLPRGARRPRKWVTREESLGCIWERGGRETEQDDSGMWPGKDRVFREEPCQPQQKAGSEQGLKRVQVPGDQEVQTIDLSLSLGSPVHPPDWQPECEDYRVLPTLPTQECWLPWRWKPVLQEHL